MNTRLVVALALWSVLGANALAAAAFPGPASWSHAGNPPSGAGRSLEQWKKGDGNSAETLSVISDTDYSYTDALAAIKKNVGDAHLTVTKDADQQCAGQTGHIFELALGKVIMDRLVVPDGKGSVQVTYTHTDTVVPSGDANGAISKFCGSNIGLK